MNVQSRHLKNILHATGALAVAFTANVAYAQEGGFVAISPLPGLSENSTDIVGFLQTVFQLSVIAAAILTVIMIAIGGFIYMTSDAFTQKSDAKRQIWSAVLGLLIILGSWVILNTINPQILNFDILRNVPESQENREDQNQNNGDNENETEREKELRSVQEFKRKCDGKVRRDNASEELKCVKLTDDERRQQNQNVSP